MALDSSACAPLSSSNEEENHISFSLRMRRILISDLIRRATYSGCTCCRLMNYFSKLAINLSQFRTQFFDSHSYA